MVTLNTFPQQESDKSEISRSVGTLIMAGLLQKCTVGEPNLIFFSQYHWHCSPTITLPRNTWKPALAARDLLILFPFFEITRL